MKTLIAGLLLASFCGVAQARIAHDYEVSCGDFKEQVRRNGWANLYIGDAGKNHPTVFVKDSSNCFSSDEDAYYVRTQIGGEACWVYSCFKSQWEAGQWERDNN